MKRMLLFIDTETTGLPKYNATTDTEKWPRIVQLAWSLYDNDGNCESQNSYIIYPTDFTIPWTRHEFTASRPSGQKLKAYRCTKCSRNSMPMLRKQK